jgi:transketolase
MQVVTKARICPYRYILPEVIRLLVSEKRFSSEQQATRHSYAKAILELGEEDPRIVVLDADVSLSVGTSEFAARFPERSFNFGIAEQNMFAAAAGMATTGLIPYATTYAAFATLRALDMIRNSIHYPRLNVKIASSHGGITPGPDGVTHQAQEDLSIMRAIANSTVVAPADPVTARLAVRASAQWEGPFYLSLTRNPLPVIYDADYPFAIGRAVTVREGSDATIVAIRDMLAQSLIAAEHLADRGVDVRVIDCHTLKPLDSATVLKAVEETGAIVTAESNVVYGGLGSAIAELLVEHDPVPMRMVGVRDTFTESGSYSELLVKYGLSAEDIVKAVYDVLDRKGAKLPALLA